MSKYRVINFKHCDMRRSCYCRPAETYSVQEQVQSTTRVDELQFMEK